MPSLADTGFSLQRHRKVVLVVDLVESVSLMQADELGVITRWQAFLQHVNQVVLPANEGRLVKSLGDGLMVEFESARQAAAGALDMHRWFDGVSMEGTPSVRLQLRAGIHIAEIFSDALDVYGAGVNLAARIATLAGPGETVVTTEARDDITDGLDASIEDLGACYLKHMNEPVRVFRVGSAGPAPVLPSGWQDRLNLVPTVTVIPFADRGGSAETSAIGDLIADSVIAMLSTSHEVRIISRLSSAPFRGRQNTCEDLKTQLSAAYVLSGSYVTSGERVMVLADVVNTESGQVVWSKKLASTIADLLDLDSTLVTDIVSGFRSAILLTEADSARSRPLPSLQSYTLLFGGISLMHRSSRSTFDKSRAAIDSVVERHSRVALPRAWLAKWHVLRVLRGMSDNPAQDGAMALRQTQTALDLEPESAVSMAMEAFVRLHLFGDHANADMLLHRALQFDASEPYRWLFHSVLRGSRGAASEAVAYAEQAKRLSPLDPMNYFFDMVHASAALANNEHAKAIQLALSSLRLNATHSPTMRVLLTAYFEIGQMADARQILARLLQEEPELNLRGYLASPNRDTGPRVRCARALSGLGLPMGH